MVYLLFSFLTALLLPIDILPFEIVYPELSSTHTIKFDLPTHWKAQTEWIKNLESTRLLLLEGPAFDQVNPTLQLTVEKSNLSENQYVEKIVDYYNTQTQTKSRYLGPIYLKNKEAQLVEIKQKLPWCKLTIMQVIHKNSPYIWILTHSCPNPYESEVFDSFYQAVKSLEISTK